ncbi:MAG: hypothetical protein RHS_4756 [Robinsoniella sp. RHS]|nr:MAG: hypothetical protein RHS_4756 [Robinsoniella sp. RHS]
MYCYNSFYNVSSYIANKYYTILFICDELQESCAWMVKFEVS